MFALRPRAKNNDNDAVGIAEAATRPTMYFVELKSLDRLDLQACTEPARVPGKPQLLSITKSGNAYLRLLLIHKRVRRCPPVPNRRHYWAIGFEVFCPGHTATSSLSRSPPSAYIAWAILRRRISFGAVGHRP